jgi:hypothetical protein
LDKQLNGLSLKFMGNQFRCSGFTAPCKPTGWRTKICSKLLVQQGFFLTVFFRRRLASMSCLPVQPGIPESFLSSMEMQQAKRFP